MFVEQTTINQTSQPQEQGGTICYGWSFKQFPSINYL